MRIRWEDVSARIYVDGVELGVYALVSFTFEESDEVDEAKYQGASHPSLDSSYRGGRATAEFRLDDQYGNPQVAYDAYIAGVKSRDGTGRVRLAVTHTNPSGGGRVGRRFDNCRVQHSERAGENQPHMVSWNLQYENSVPIGA